MVIHWTKHAADRAREMGVSAGEVEAAVSEPETSYPIPSPYPMGTTFCAGRLAVPVARDGSVLTVLWRGKESRQWH